jgi:hypothetical protein
MKLVVGRVAILCVKGSDAHAAGAETFVRMIPAPIFHRVASYP